MPILVGAVKHDVPLQSSNHDIIREYFHSAITAGVQARWDIEDIAAFEDCNLFLQ